MAALRKRWLRRPPSWLDLIERVREAASKASLRVWTLEDYPTHLREILSTFCGTSHVEDMHLPPTPRAIPPAPSVGEIEAIGRWYRRGAYRRRVRGIFQDLPSGEIYSPLEPEERTILAEAYRRDIKLIGVRFPGVLMRFDQSIAPPPGMAASPPSG